MEAEPVAQSGYVYVLKLEGGNWYVGWSGDIETRIASQFLGRGAQWTRLHPPVSVESVRPGDTVMESAVTMALMAKHGWRKVRGGQWLAITMPCAPPPLLKAFALRPPPPLPEEETVETIGEHSLIMTKIQDTGPSAWRARVSGAKAARTCPARGFKTLYAETETELRAAVQQFIDG